MKHLTPWGIYWVFVWFIVGFGVPEAIGLIFNTSWTLSRNWWGIENVDTAHPFDFAEWTPIHWVIGLIMFTGLVWLAGHLVLGIWR